MYTIEDCDFTGVSFANPMDGWVSGYWNQVHLTTDGGNTWTMDSSYSPPNTPTRDVQFITADSGWTVGGISGDMTISRTTDGGNTWIYYESVLCGSSLREIQMTSSLKGWVVGSYNCPPYIARTTDGGQTWETQGTAGVGFESISMVDENYGWACGSGGLLYHTSNGGVTWVEDEVRIPTRFALHQNYPNPFNAISNFRFGIAKSSNVTLTIYDLLGQKIATIVNERLSSGSYTRQWDATGQPSGVYFYRMQAGNFVDVRKLLLLK